MLPLYFLSFSNPYAAVLPPATVHAAQPALVHATQPTLVPAAQTAFRPAVQPALGPAVQPASVPPSQPAFIPAAQLVLRPAWDPPQPLAPLMWTGWGWMPMMTPPALTPMMLMPPPAAAPVTVPTLTSAAVPLPVSMPTSAAVPASTSWSGESSQDIAREVQRKCQANHIHNLTRRGLWPVLEGEVVRYCFHCQTSTFIQTTLAGWMSWRLPGCAKDCVCWGMRIMYLIVIDRQHSGLKS